MPQNEVVPAEESEQPSIDTEPLVWPPAIYPYHAGIVGGLVGGAAMALVGTVAGIIIRRGPWYPVNLLAAAAIRDFQEMSPGQLGVFSLEGLFVGTVLHFTIAVLIGLSFTVLLPTFPGHPLIWSIIAGGILWVFADIVLLPLLNPKMFDLVDVPSFVIAHLAYTILLGLVVNRYDKIPIHLVRPSEVYPYPAGVLGGLVGGAAMALVGTVAGIVIGRGPWYPVNLLAAAAIRRFQTLNPAQLSAFSLEGLFVGVVLHFTISIVIGVLFALLLPIFPGHPVVWSVIGGSALWVMADILFLALLNPAMARLVDVPSFIIAHFGYTILLGLWVSRYETKPSR
jgi:uncharacterized membrane protein YagU involved in acid resistance